MLTSTAVILCGPFPLLSSVHKVGLEEVAPGGGSSSVAVRSEPSMRVLSLRPNMEAFFRMNWVKWCGDGALRQYVHAW